MYCASSRRRACTLKLPSVVLSSALSWLKLSESFTASALTMPRRTRAWTSRSSSAARNPPRSLLSPCSTASVCLAAPCLATVPPSNDHAEHDVQAAEPRGHEPASPRRRAEQRHGPDEHEADPHHGDDADRERAARDEPGPVQEQPGAGQRVPPSGTVQRHRLSDEAEVVERTVVQRPRSDHDTHTMSRRAAVVKYFVIQSTVPR